MTAGKKNSEFIVAPTRLPSFGIAIVLVTVAVLSIALILVDGGRILSAAVLLGMLLLALIRSLDYAVHASLLASLTLLLTYFPSLSIWPLGILLPLMAYGVVVGLTPSLRQSVGWIRKGSMDSGVIKLIIITVIVSAFSLISWMIFIKPDIEHHLALMPNVPLWMYPMVGILFAVFNAAMEESVYRGVFMEALDSALGAGYWSVCIQAIPFAALHYMSGFPNGVLGFFMTLIYGVMLGAIRRYSKGMLAPFVTHIAADVTIFSIVAYITIQSSWGNDGTNRMIRYSVSILLGISAILLFIAPLHMPESYSWMANVIDILAIVIATGLPLMGLSWPLLAGLFQRLIFSDGLFMVWNGGAEYRQSTKMSYVSFW